MPTTLTFSARRRVLAEHCKFEANFEMEDDNMAKYLVTASYTVEGAKGLLADGGTRRREVVENLINGMGGSMELFYYAFGGNDAYIIADIPDHATMTAISLAVSATGSVSLNTTVLITPEEVDEAVQKTVNYTRPGA